MARRALGIEVGERSVSSGRVYVKVQALEHRSGFKHTDHFIHVLPKTSIRKEESTEIG